jgi:hypothetical protein
VCCCFSFGFFSSSSFRQPSSFFLALFFFGFLNFFVFRFSSFSPLFGTCIFLRAFFSFLFFPLLLASPLSVGFLLNFLPFWGSGREGVLEMVEMVERFFCFPNRLDGFFVSKHHHLSHRSRLIHFSSSSGSIYNLLGSTCPWNGLGTLSFY